MICISAGVACGAPEQVTEQGGANPAPAAALPAVLPRVLDLFSEPLIQMNEAPMPSLTAAEGTIELWVSRTGWEAYGQVRAHQNGSHVTLPVGTTVLRAVRDPQGQITKYTALVKREPGFDPPGDLWFGVYDASGDLVRTPEGKELRGKLPACMICHLARAEDGYVFGRTD
jgi:hypothetical protein